MTRGIAHIGIDEENLRSELGKVDCQCQCSRGFSFALARARDRKGLGTAVFGGELKGSPKRAIRFSDR